MHLKGHTAHHAFQLCAKPLPAHFACQSCSHLHGNSKITLCCCTQLNLDSPHDWKSRPWDLFCFLSRDQFACQSLGQAPIPMTPWQIFVPEPLYIQQSLHFDSYINGLEELSSPQCRKVRL